MIFNEQPKSQPISKLQVQEAFKRVKAAHVKNMGRSLKFEKKTNGFFNIFFLFT